MTPRLALLLAVCLTAACSHSSEVIDPDGDGDGDPETIQELVDAAEPGDTIEIDPGTYVESVRIQKTLTLRGAGPDSIIELPADAELGEAAVEIREAVNVRFEGFTVRAPAAESDGIVVRDASDVVIADVVVSGAGDEGVDVRSSSGVQVSGAFEGNADQGIQVREASQGVDIDASVVSGNGDDGVRVEDSSDVTVRNSTINSNAQDGVKFERTTDCSAEDNTVSTNGDDGVLIGESTGAQVLRNTITDNTGNGLRIRASPDTLYEDNTITGNLGGDLEED